MSNLNSVSLKYVESRIESGTITLVSYGLAPNPFGFCYEHESGYLDSATMSRHLDSLTKEEELHLIKTYLR